MSLQQGEPVASAAFNAPQLRTTADVDEATPSAAIADHQQYRADARHTPAAATPAATGLGYAVDLYGSTAGQQEDLNNQQFYLNGMNNNNNNNEALQRHLRFLSDQYQNGANYGPNSNTLELPAPLPGPWSEFWLRLMAFIVYTGACGFLLYLTASGTFKSDGTKTLYYVLCVILISFCFLLIWPWVTVCCRQIVLSVDGTTITRSIDCGGGCLDFGGIVTPSNDEEKLELSQLHYVAAYELQDRRVLPRRSRRKKDKDDLRDKVTVCMFRREPKRPEDAESCWDRPPPCAAQKTDEEKEYESDDEDWQNEMKRAVPVASVEYAKLAQHLRGFEAFFETHRRSEMMAIAPQGGGGGGGGGGIVDVEEERTTPPIEFGRQWTIKVRLHRKKEDDEDQNETQQHQGDDDGEAARRRRPRYVQKTHVNIAGPGLSWLSFVVYLGIVVAGAIFVFFIFAWSERVSQWRADRAAGRNSTVTAEQRETPWLDIYLLYSMFCAAIVWIIIDALLTNRTMELKLDPVARSFSYSLKPVACCAALLGSCMTTEVKDVPLDAIVDVGADTLVDDDAFVISENKLIALRIRSDAVLGGAQLGGGGGAGGGGIVSLLLCNPVANDCCLPNVRGWCEMLSEFCGREIRMGAIYNDQ